MSWFCYCYCLYNFWRLQSENPGNCDSLFTHRLQTPQEEKHQSLHRFLAFLTLKSRKIEALRLFNVFFFYDGLILSISVTQIRQLQDSNLSVNQKHNYS